VRSIRFRRVLGLRPSAATTISIIALFVALSGTGYAALTLPRNSVASPQVIDGSLKKRDLADTTIAALKGVRGAPGSIGPTGATGPSGPAGLPATALWSVIAANGSTARNSHVTSSEKVATGQYAVIFDRDVKACAFLGSIGGTGAESVVGQISVTRRSINANGVFAKTFDSAGVAADKSFHLAVFC
jgi:hypothetical protein